MELWWRRPHAPPLPAPATPAARLLCLVAHNRSRQRAPRAACGVLLFAFALLVVRACLLAFMTRRLTPNKYSSTLCVCSPPFFLSRSFAKATTRQHAKYAQQCADHIDRWAVNVSPTPNNAWVYDTVIQQNRASANTMPGYCKPKNNRSQLLKYIMKLRREAELEKKRCPEPKGAM